MTDRELLELAAKAAGIEVVGFANRLLVLPNYEGSFVIRHPRGGDVEWNPLADDGDALRLAVKLGMNVWCDPAAVCMAEVLKTCLPRQSESAKPDPYAATRRAIVRAAAEVGKAMP